MSHINTCELLDEYIKTQTLQNKYKFIKVFDKLIYNQILTFLPFLKQKIIEHSLFKIF